MTFHEINTPLTPEKVLAHDSIASSESLQTPLLVGAEVLPWLDEPVELNPTRVEMKDMTCPDFLVASAVGTNADLVKAANAMKEGESRNANNMFWSRIGGFVRDGYHPHIETMPEPAGEVPIHIMRNNGGQRVYFSTIQTEQGLAIIRLGICDKNKQGLVLKHLSGAGDRRTHRKMTK